MRNPVRASTRAFSPITLLVSLLLVLLAIVFVLCAYLDQPGIGAAVLGLVLAVSFGAAQLAR
jgi:hypothetical protein